MKITKLYTGTRPAEGSVIVRVDGKKLRVRLDLFNHSPDGFEWGYGGSGPAQLALAILADLLEDDERAVRLHQDFKWAVITPLPQHSDWTLSAAQVLATVTAIEEKHVSQ